MSAGRSRRACAGLTLVEILVTLAVSSLLLTGAWRLVHAGLRAYRRGLQEVAVAQEARAVLAVLGRDVQRVGAAGPGALRGEDHHEATAAKAPVAADRLTLLAVFGDTAPAPRRVRYTLVLPGGEQPPGLTRTVVLPGREQQMVLGKRVRAFNVRYFDGQAWHDAWQRAELPRALELTLTFQGEPQLHPFVTVVALP
ncbi:MAG: hypothetical protein KatS3mg131_2450 [Candidatus Tectimicrobiota bacterium]|nr:MAG: hypothetical protein KatS3mg131_2450 [Candidatus Tectomicrobia bacterium]